MTNFRFMVKTTNPSNRCEYFAHAAYAVRVFERYADHGWRTLLYAIDGEEQVLLRDTNNELERW